MKKRRLRRCDWTPQDVAFLRRHYPHTLTTELATLLGRTYGAVKRKARDLRLKKTPQAIRLAQQRPNAGQYRKGQYPAGKWDQEAYATPGALRLADKAGLMIRISPEPHPRGWEILARYVWRTERGPIPPGHVVRARNGDPDDARIENLYLATKAQVLHENTWHRYPEPVRKAVQLRGVLNRMINRIEGKHPHGRRQYRHAT